MILYRFIGVREYNNIMSGGVEFNEYDWSRIYDTNSKGICFFAYNRTNNIDKIVNIVLNDWGFAGIVKEYAIIQISVPKARKAWGWYDSGKHTEYNLTRYTLHNVTKVWKIQQTEEIWGDFYNYKTKEVEL